MMTDKNDKWFYLIAGIIGGALIGVVLQKFILQLGAQQTTLYGASYSYDKESGRLTSYMPLPIPMTPIVAPASTPVATTTQTQSSSLLSSLISSEIPLPMKIEGEKLI